MEGRDHRSGGVGRADLEQLRRVLDRRQIRGRRRGVEGRQAHGQLVDGPVPLGVGQVGPHVGERLARRPAR